MSDHTFKWPSSLQTSWGWLAGNISVIVIAGAFIWSFAVIVSRKAEEAKPGEIIIRLAHYQLEPGIRDAFNDMAAEYRKLHPNVRIKQEAIPESTYGQWVTTQIIAGSPPDILQAGEIPPALLSQYNIRYFLPLTPLASAPNPYNKGTELEEVPLAATFKDGMRRGFVDEAQEYMRILPSMLGMRLLYNRDLLKKLTGETSPPEDLATFLRLCEQIRSHRLADGVAYTPIAGSQYHAGMWQNYFAGPYTYAALPEVDLNRDGRFGKEELFAAVYSGKMGLDHPAYKARLDLFGSLTPNFQSGFVGLKRDDAVILFANQRAVFLLAGLWEVQGIIEQARGSFDLGFMAMPDPLSDDPLFGKYLLGPRYEESGTQLPLVVTRSSQHPEVASDFLLFLCGQKQNERFNQKIGWLPSVIGAQTAPELMQFQPSSQGMYSTFDVQMGGETTIRWQQLLALFEIGQISSEELIKTFSEFYVSAAGKKDFDEFIRTWRRRQRGDEQLGVALRVLAERGGKDNQRQAAENIFWSRQLGPQLNFERVERLVREGSDSPLLQRKPYERSALSKKNLKKFREPKQ